MRNVKSVRDRYDVIIVGSGLGGLVTAVTLAKEGKHVCVLEKNNQFGGNLQTFSRNKKIFDTGVHYLGGLAVGQNLYQYFDYLGIMDELQLETMPTVFDEVLFGDEAIRFPMAQGYTAFVDHLTQFFPDERATLLQYVEDLQYTCRAFPLYYVEDGEGYKSTVLHTSVRAYMQKLTTNERLRAVLVGNNFLYGGEEHKTPFYVYALALNSYIMSAYRCTLGGSQISKLLIKRLRALGGEAYKREEVTDVVVENGAVVRVETHSGKQLQADQYVLNIDPKRALQMVGKENFRKTYFDRIQELPVTTSCFSVHVVLKPQKIAYAAHNLYYHDSMDSVWQATHDDEATWPTMFMLSMNKDPQHPAYAETLTLLSYMDFDAVAPWAHTFNTAASPAARGEDYDLFKQRKAKLLIDKLKTYLPEIDAAIAQLYVATPLSYRDYIGVHRGNLYGHSKDVADPLKTFMSPKTKISNLFLTGHAVYMHGVLGVTIGAMATCAEMIGKSNLLEKIRQASDRTKENQSSGGVQ